MCTWIWLLVQVCTWIWLLVLMVRVDDLLGDFLRLLLLEDRSDERVNFLRLLFGFFSRTCLAAPPATLLAHSSCKDDSLIIGQRW